MKKLFLLMLATVMLLTAAPTALSEEETVELPPDLFDVLLYDGESPTRASSVTVSCWPRPR